MPLNSVQSMVYNLLDGLALPGQQQALQAFIAPPNPGDLSQPQVYIWGGEWTDNRQTMPRGSTVGSQTASGYRKLKYSLNLYVMYVTYADAPGVDQAFSLILDAVSSALWQAPMPATLTDPTTSYASQLLAIAEQMTVQQAPVQALSPEGIVLYDAMYTISIEEKVQA